ncbi:uncharacterized protein EURHEDRAFT_416345 [Aspergillus ruber CBS 135680]|uniref:Uncharacterized protein n=1 Tax=Aspergillus ruber (strain CBS 135680) TaxID=1388766 RepID=A0A017S361_ASPRC|nr:uncharacterized protein EURHEDRAFT_416345 [Aspergillus ruber CBS 135680]EYE91468.1 hypothetical protein EURHEDRAFT_416345 [Aspergillus ruber CBS 135680]
MTDMSVDNLIGSTAKLFGLDASRYSHYSYLPEFVKRILGKLLPFQVDSMAHPFNDLKLVGYSGMRCSLFFSVLVLRMYVLALTHLEAQNKC